MSSIAAVGLANRAINDLKNSGVVFIERISAQRFFIWIRQPASKWMQYEVIRDTRPAENVDVWRVNTLRFGDLSGDNPISNFKSPMRGGKSLTNTISPMATNSQWEYAIQLEGAPDAFGGYHGDEMMQEAVFLLNGRPFTYDPGMITYEVRYGYKFELIQKTFVYNPAEPTTKVGEIIVHHVFTADGLSVKWDLTWEVNANISYAYGGMLPVQRNANNGVHFCRFADDLTIHDISLSSHTVPRKNTTAIELWNNGSLLSARVEVDPDFFNGFAKSAGYGMWVTNAENYNKVYPTRVHLSQLESVTAGDIWTCSVKYKIILPKPYTP